MPNIYNIVMTAVWGALTVLNVSALDRALREGSDDKIMFWILMTAVGVGFLIYRGYKAYEATRGV